MEERIVEGPRAAGFSGGSIPSGSLSTLSLITEHLIVFEAGKGHRSIAVIFSNYLVGAGGNVCLANVCVAGEQSHQSSISGVPSGKREIVERIRGWEF